VIRTTRTEPLQALYQGHGIAYLRARQAFERACCFHSSVSADCRQAAACLDWICLRVSDWTSVQLDFQPDRQIIRECGTYRVIRMHLNWRRGLFRCLVVLALVGAGYAGLSWQWSDRLEVDCWSRIAKWPDGQPFTVFDLFEQENTRANVELNKTRDVWAAESIVTRNQWVTSTKQKLIACETGEPVESLQGQASNVWTNLRSSLLGLTIPPLAILTVIWMASGFRAQAHRQQAAEAVVPVLLNLQQSVDDARLVHAGVNPQVAAQAALGQEATQAQQPQATETPQPDSPHPKHHQNSRRPGYPRGFKPCWLILAARLLPPLPPIRWFSVALVVAGH
jgi:hypothetical protein